LLFAIYQLWGNEANQEWAIKWHELLDIYRQAKIAIAEAQVLTEFDNEQKRGRGAGSVTKLLIDSILGRSRGSVSKPIGRPKKEIAQEQTPEQIQRAEEEEEIIAGLRKAAELNIGQ